MAAEGQALGTLRGGLGVLLVAAQSEQMHGSSSSRLQAAHAQAFPSPAVSSETSSPYVCR